MKTRPPYGPQQRVWTTPTWPVDEVAGVSHHVPDPAMYGAAYALRIELGWPVACWEGKR